MLQFHRNWLLSRELLVHGRHRLRRGLSRLVAQDLRLRGVLLLRRRLLIGISLRVFNINLYLFAQQFLQLGLQRLLRSHSGNGALAISVCGYIVFGYVDEVEVADVFFRRLF